NRFLSSRVQQHLSIIYREGGQLDDAQAACRQAVDECEKVVQAYPDNVTFAMNLGFMLGTRGDVHRDRGETEEALSYYEEAIKRLQGVLDINIPHVERREYLTLAQVGRAVALAQSGKHSEAATALAQVPEGALERTAREIRLGTILVEAYGGNYSGAAEKGEEVAKNKNSPSRDQRLAPPRSPHTFLAAP